MLICGLSQLRLGVRRVPSEAERGADAEPAAPRSGAALTVAEAADVLSTTVRFPRRLIEQRRVRFVRVGRHVRIPESALREFIEAGLVEPVTTRKRSKIA